MEKATGQILAVVRYDFMGLKKQDAFADLSKWFQNGWIDTVKKIWKNTKFLLQNISGYGIIIFAEVVIKR